MIDYVKRLAGPYTGAGQDTFPFSFKIFEASNIYVSSAASADDSSPVHLVLGQDFTVSMNQDQNATPGGTIKLTTPLVGSQVIVIGSDLKYRQTVQLTNYDRFPPEIINDALDRIVVMIQQIVEQLDRTLVVPVTQTKTPEELIAELLSAQSDAQKKADEAVKAAAEAQTAAKAATKAVEGLTQIQTEQEQRVIAQGDTQVQRVQDEGNSQVERLNTEGDTQVQRVQEATDQTLLGYGLAGIERTWTATAAISAGTTITLPDNAQYIVGHHHLRLSWNGLVLYPNENFTEVGEVDQFSGTFKLTFDVSVGDVIDAWIIPLGRGDITQTIQEVAALRDSVADLSQKVVYKSAEAAGD